MSYSFPINKERIGLPKTGQWPGVEAGHRGESGHLRGHAVFSRGTFGRDSGSE